MNKTSPRNPSRFRPVIESLEDRRVLSVSPVSLLSEALSTATADLVAESSSTVMGLVDGAAPLATAAGQLVQTATPLTLSVTALLPDTLDGVLDIGTNLVAEVTTLASVVPDTLGAVLDIGTGLVTDVASLATGTIAALPLEPVLGAVIDLEVVTIDIGSDATVGGSPLLPLPEIIIDMGGPEQPSTIPLLGSLPGDNQAVVGVSNPQAGALPWWMQAAGASNTLNFSAPAAEIQEGVAADPADAELDLEGVLLAELTDMLLTAGVDDAAAEAMAANLLAGDDWSTLEFAEAEAVPQELLDDAGLLAGTGILGLRMLTEAFEQFLQELAELNRTLWGWLAQVGPVPWILMAAAAVASMNELVRWRLRNLQTPRISPLGLQIG